MVARFFGGFLDGRGIVSRAALVWWNWSEGYFDGKTYLMRLYSKGCGSRFMWLEMQYHFLGYFWDNFMTIVKH